MMEAMATRDDVTVRIDTELRAWARELEINMSRLFEDALRAEIAQRRAIAETLSEGVTDHKLELVDREGVEYIGRFTGKLIAGDDDNDVYVTDDQRVLVHNRNSADVDEIDDPAEGLQWLDRDEYLVAMSKLGLEPVKEVRDL